MIYSPHTNDRIPLVKRNILLLLALTFLTLSASAQRMGEARDTDDNLIKAALRGWHVRVGGGISLGGTSPMPLPREIRAIKSYKPTLCITIAGAAQKKFDPHWGMMVGVQLENKGMETDARVKNYHMEAVNDDGSGKVVGAWTGYVKTKVSNNYLTFPILATYTFNDRWQVFAGPYLSWMWRGEFTGEAYDGYIRDQDPRGQYSEVSSASYDFSRDLRRFHWGLDAGGEFKAYKHLAVSLDLKWGLNGIFPSDFGSVTFPLYPIYATLGFHYLF